MRSKQAALSNGKGKTDVKMKSLIHQDEGRKYPILSIKKLEKRLSAWQREHSAEKEIYKAGIFTDPKNPGKQIILEMDARDGEIRVRIDGGAYGKIIDFNFWLPLMTVDAVTYEPAKIPDIVGSQAVIDADKVVDVLDDSLPKSARQVILDEVEAHDKDMVNLNFNSMAAAGFPADPRRFVEIGLGIPWDKAVETWAVYSITMGGIDLHEALREVYALLPRVKALTDIMLDARKKAFNGEKSDSMLRQVEALAKG